MGGNKHFYNDHTIAIKIIVFFYNVVFFIFLLYQFLCFNYLQIVFGENDKAIARLIWLFEEKKKRVAHPTFLTVINKYTNRKIKIDRKT